MAYVKTIWENLPSENTPINASNLNKIENGIYDNSVAIETINTNINNITGQILWTNPNPSNLIPNDLNINILSDEDYDILGVYYKTANDGVDVEYNQTIKGMNFNIGTIGYNGAGLRRRIIRNSKTSYTIKQYVGETLSDSATGKYIIPIYIVGYKIGLFN